MRFWVLQRSLRRAISRIGRLCQHQVGLLYYSVPLFILMILHCSIALYGLILFYALTKEELAGNRPLAKFLSIKLIVVFTFYQSFIVRRVVYFRTRPSLTKLRLHALGWQKFNLLKGRVIHGTQFWTATNIADGLDALAVCIEVWAPPFFPGHGSCFLLLLADEYAR